MQDIEKSALTPLAAALTLACGVIGSAAQAGPTPTITISATTGNAPLAIHTHALSSSLTIGDPLTARYQWDFGDAAGQHTKIDGWNAAHLYSTPGTYTVKLTVTDQLGASATATRTIVVSPSNRSTIYVSAYGHDANAGTSSSAPIRTAARAQQLLTSNRAILFRKGDTFDVASEFLISQQNVYLGSYGTGVNPTLHWIGSSSTYSGIVGMSSTTRDVVVEGLDFDSAHALSLSIVRGIQPDGSNITVRNCNFRDVSYAINAERVVDNLLVQSNTTGIVGAYFVWGVGTNHTIIGNTVAGSASQHLIRLGGVDRCLIASNSLTNQTNSTIWAMLGSYCTIANNTLRGGRCLVGPNQAVGSPSERFPYVVMENNMMWDETFHISAGAEHIALRNNISNASGRSAFEVSGYHAAMNRRPIDVRICNNTAINTSSVGRFVKVHSGAQQVALCNNLYKASAMVPAGSETANVFVSDSSLASFTTISYNVWAIPASTPWVSGARHYVWPYWSDAQGYKTSTQWAALANVTGEAYENPWLGADYKPATNSQTAAAGRRVSCVHTDFYGSTRPSGSVWSAGAVEVNSSGGGMTNNQDGDITGDGQVNINDLVEVLTRWGTCMTYPCSGDVNGDGVVNINDLVLVITNWD